MSEIRIPRNRPKALPRLGLFTRAPKASPVSREDDVQRIVDSYLKRLDDRTLDRLGYSAEQIDRLRHGKSARVTP